jgi:hypothetical protein
VLLLIPGSEGTSVKVAGDDPVVAKLVADGFFTVGEAVRADLVLPEIEQLMSLQMT